MATVGVITDSCASIPPSLVEEWGIKVIPYFVTVDGRMLRDLIDVHQSEFFDYLRKTPVLPTTANPGPGEYLEAFTELAPKVTGIVTAHMTSLGSGAYQAACVARDMLKASFPDLPVEIVDTRNVSMGHGWFALEAARAAARGWSVAQIAQMMKRMLPVTRIVQTAETLDYLYKGGRIGRASHMVGTLLRIKPVITMDDGVIVPLAQVRARDMQKVYQKMIDVVRMKWGGAALKVAVVHTAALDSAERLRDMAGSQLNCAELFLAEMSPTLGVHIGPNSLSLCYVPAEALPES